jgi:aminotransferase
MKDFINPEVKNLKPSGIRKFFDLASSTPGVVSLGVGEPDFDTPWHISDAGISSIEEGKTFYTSNSGLIELREAIGRFLKRKYGLSYNADEVLVTVGGSELIDLACRSLISRGDEAIVCYPAYVSYEPCVELAGGKVIPLQLKEANGFKIDAEELDKLITPKTKMLIMNYPNNPTGGEMDLDSLQKLADVCIKRDIMVVTDEIYSELVYVGKHISIAAMPGMKERTLVINGFSKSYSMTGWRLGYTAGPKEIIKAMTKIHQYAIMCPTTASQYAGIEALDNGDEDIVRMRDEYARRRLYILHRLTQMGLSCYEPLGAFYVFPNIKKFGLSSEEFCTRLVKEAKVAIIPGTAFGDCGEGFVRISYAYSIKDIGKALDKMEKFIEKLGK